ncbi:protein kinase domain-containing protein [Actinomadura scrupuli]|uniref:serine/threonine-protein kinase n=1 Tax=Actinomadura scrupuli TaxID=559629 RepID=UPI003D99DBD7
MTQDQGRLLGHRYRLVAAVGRGGMGTVWRAYDETLDREVAIKEVLLPPGLSPAEREVLYQRTFREARASARLSHPGVVTVHDVLSEDDRPWIVMELVRARSLQDVIDDDGPVAPRTAADIGRQVLAALSHAHRAGILHRDVKPSNVLITDDGRAVLTDFGIAQVEGDAALTQTGLVMGSPAYIPPERVQGERAVPASDLWALGATLYAAVEGKAPYERSDAMAALAAALTEEVPPPRNAGSLRRVLDGLLTRSPAQRMTAETAMPLLIEVAGERVVPPRGAPAADATMMDRPPAGPASGALETVLDSAAIERAVRDSAAGQGMVRPATFRPRDGADPGRGAGGPATSRPQEPARRPEAEQRTEIQPDWQPPEHGSWQPAEHDSWQLPGSTHPPGYEPYQPHRQRPPRRTRTVVLVLLAAIVVAASLIAGAVILKNRASASGSSGSSGNSAISGGGQAVPAGYHLQQENGYLVAVPADWRREQRTDGVFFHAPDGTTLLQIGQTPWSVSTVSAQAATSDESFAQRTNVFPGYTRQEIRDPVAYKGTQAADLEFTYTDSHGGPAHAVDRFVKLDDRPYAIYFRSLEKDWAGSQATLTAIYDSFRVA